MENNQPRIRKVHLNSFIDILTSLYNRGVDYIDIMAIEGDSSKQDGVGISFRKEYMSKEMESDFEDFPVIINPNDDKLTDNDLNQLI